MQHPFEDLRRHVVSSPCDFAAFLGLPCGSPKIDDLDMIIYPLRIIDIKKDNVINLDIPMHDPKPMQVCQSSEQLLHDADHQRLWKLFQLLDQFDDRSSFAILHNHIVEGLVVIDLVQFDDIWMV